MNKCYIFAPNLKIFNLLMEKVLLLYILRSTKKLWLFLSLFVLTMSGVFAQASAFRANFSVTDATCFNNGKIAYSVVDGNGNPVNSAYLEAAGLSKIRLYHKVHEADSAQYSASFYTGGVDTFLIDYGTYIVGLECLLADGHGGFVRLDTQTVLTVNTSYVVPEVSGILVTDYTGYNLGLHPTLSCMNLGRVQLKMKNGRFPYAVNVVNHETSRYLRTVVFDGKQYSGTDENRYDYHEYYTIDSLPGGVWDFYMVDGCQYGLPRTTETVEVVQFPYLDYVEIYASSGNMEDSNVVKVNVVINSPYDYYTEMIPDYVQYRFTHEGFADGPWHNMPSINGGHIVLYDTIPEADDYCQIWNKDISLQYKISVCENQVITRTFKLYGPNSTKFESQVVDVQDSVLSALNSCQETKYWHRDAYTIRYQSYMPNYLTKDGDHSVYRHHYTHPLTWIYTDMSTGNVIKRDTVSAINQKSSLDASEVTALYGPLPQNINVQRRLVDGHGCELYSTTDLLEYKIGSNVQDASWNVTSSGDDHCCNVLRNVTVKGNFSQGVNADGTIIRLVRSPYNDRYNFTAVFHAATGTWDIVRSNVQNVALIAGSADGRSLELKDYCLPSGPYHFQIVTSCDSVVIQKRVSFGAIYSVELTEEPDYHVQKECMNQYVIYDAGQISRVSRNTSPVTGLEMLSVIVPVTTSFKVVSGPVGGYDDRTFALHEPIRMSIPGTYIVKIFPTTTMELCEETAFYDTVVFGTTTVEHLYAYALLCDHNSSVGNVYVRGVNGTEPYTYTLYSRPNRQGEVLGGNNEGVFPNIAMRTDSAMSCMIQDACGAYFHVNFYPQLLADLQVTWFDGGLRAMTTCEGSTVTVHTLQSDNLFSYHWSGPNGFEYDSPEAFIFVPRGADDGWYKVTVFEGGCGAILTDSIYLGVKTAPKVEISQNATICPGEEVQLMFTPTSSVPTSMVDFSIVFETSEGVQVKNYSSLSNESVADYISPLLPTKVYPLTIQDDECGYAMADPGDTVFISIRDEVINACSLIMQHDKVCYEETAHLAVQATLAPPYTVRWYGDYNQTQLLQEDVISNSGDWSKYDTSGIVQQTLLYVSVDKEGYCPSVNGVTTNVLSMADGTYSMNCNQSFRLYDSGGRNDNYSQGEVLTQTFVSTDGRPITLRFDELDLSNTSHLLVISGTTLDLDSIMYDLTNLSNIPELIISNGRAMTLMFLAGMVPARGWSAVVAPLPGVVIADAYNRTHTVLYDEVCQSQYLTYTNPLNISPEVATNAEMNEAMKRAGTHVFSYTFAGADSHNCDSIVTFVLTVTPPPFVDTTVVTSNFQLDGNPYHWRGNEYSETGRYSVIYTRPDGCDSLDILNLIVLEIDTTTNEICVGDQTTMGIIVNTPHLSWDDGVIPAVNAPGDVLCTDGSILRVDSFLMTDKTAKGVIYYLDRTGLHGKAIALEDAPDAYAVWAPNPNTLYQSIHAKSFTPYQRNALFDLDGLGNTIMIKQYAEQSIGMEFSYNAPAAYYCYYYDAVTRGVNTSGTSGWHMPAMGELNLVFGNRVAINSTLQKLNSIGASVMDLGRSYYLSSSEANVSQCWHLDYSGHFVTNLKSERHKVRPTIDF